MCSFLRGICLLIAHRYQFIHHPLAIEDNMTIYFFAYFEEIDFSLCVRRKDRELAQMARAPALGAGGREFESRIPEVIICIPKDVTYTHAGVAQG